jgi:hypothetical protein
MSTSAACPRCSQTLISSDAGLTCEQCEGRFVSDASIDVQWLGDPAEPEATKPISCPGCDASMNVKMLGTTEIDVCPECSGVWLDKDEALPATDRGALQQFLMYSLSLPERVVRSSVGVVAGAAQETAGLLIPQSFQSAKTYELVVTNSLGFLTGTVGGVKTEQPESTTREDFMARKAVGNFVDLAGMATLHVSPVWLLAIVSDVAYGTSSYVQQLAGELKEQGLIDDTSTIHHVDDVLKAIQDGSGDAASLFDTPPLSVEQLRETLDRTRESLTSVDYAEILPESELRQYWSEMQEISATNGVSLLGVSGALAINTLGKLETAVKGTFTGVKVAGGLLNNHVIGHYSDSLQAIHDKGLFESLSGTSGPYIEAVWNNFADDKPTWTEDLLTGKLAIKGWKKITSWVGGE